MSGMLSGLGLGESMGAFGECSFSGVLLIPSYFLKLRVILRPSLFFYSSIPALSLSCLLLLRGQSKENPYDKFANPCSCWPPSNIQIYVGLQIRYPNILSLLYINNKSCIQSSVL